MICPKCGERESVGQRVFDGRNIKLCAQCLWLFYQLRKVRDYFGYMDSMREDWGCRTKRSCVALKTTIGFQRGIAGNRA